MKSVVAEASSISKAIELAWQKAGQPKEFLIKVFQEPQRNMFGLTKTSAKVGIFFDDAAMIQKIKHAVQNTIPITQNISPITSNKQISPIKPIQSKNNFPKPQPAVKIAKPIAPKTETINQPRPAQPVKNVAQVNTQPIKTEEIKIEVPIIVPQVNQAVSETSNLTPNNLVLNPSKPKRRYYHRRKPKSSRPNGDAPQVNTSTNKSDN